MIPTGLALSFMVAFGAEPFEALTWLAWEGEEAIATWQGQKDET